MMDVSQHVHEGDAEARHEMYRLALSMHREAQCAAAPEARAAHCVAAAGFAQAAGMFAVAEAIRHVLDQLVA